MDLNELPYKELQALLEELELEDDTLRKSVSKLTLDIDKEDSLDFIDNSEEETEDTSDITTKLDSVQSLSINKNLRNKVSKERASKYRIRIQRLAVNQSLIKLSDEIPNYDLQTLAKALTEKQSAIADRAAESANKRLKRLLNSLIPVPVRRMYISYPWVIRRCPGFIYSAIYNTPKQNRPAGQEVNFWATPDIPYYFRQGTEVNILSVYRTDFLYLVDNAVNTYFKYQELQEDKALSIASRIIKNKVQTYFDLLMYNPRWFEILYNIIKDAEIYNAQTSGTV